MTSYAIEYVFCFGICIFFCLFVWIGRKQNQSSGPPKWTSIAATAIAVLIGLMMAIRFFCEQSELARLRANLETVRTTGGAVLVNARPLAVSERQTILDELMSVAGAPAHHSSGQGRIDVELQSKNGIQKLVLQRDSIIPNEIWVSYPKENGKLFKVGMARGRHLSQLLDDAIGGTQ